ncbi:MAG: histone H1 [Bacteroidetes bacterium]|nr:histone H1 [Bacteroidota bacterium]
MAKKLKRPKDGNQLAKLIVELATGEASEPDQDKGKDPNAVALGRKGGLKGGKARANKLTPERRKEIAQKAAEKRWKKKE